MDFLVLGPLEVRDSGRRVPLGGPKQRAVLAILLVHANRVVSRDRLIDGVWGDRPPRTAPHVVESYISQLRRILRDSGHGAELLTHGHGYPLATGSTQLDLHRFEELLANGRRRLGAGDAAAAAETLTEALRLFRGPPLEDLAFAPFARAEAQRLEEVRLGALQDRVAAELQAGRGAELVAELQTLSEQHPFAEPFRAQLMLALYRAGRQAEALEVYRKTHRLLAGELGLEPSDSLRQLQQGILRHDPALAPKATPPGAPVSPTSPGSARQRRLGPRIAGRHLLAAAAAAVVVGVATSTALIGHGAASRRPISGNAVAVLNLQNSSLVGEIPLGAAPGRIAVGAGSLWVTNFDDHTIRRIEPRSLKLGQTIQVGAGPSDIAVGRHGVWVANSLDGTLSRIDPGTDEVVQTIPVGNGPSAVAVGGGSLWVANADGHDIAQVDETTGALTRRIAVPVRPTDVAFGGGAVWISSESTGAVLRVDPVTSDIAQINVGTGPASIAAGAGAVWVANFLDGTVSRIDSASRAVAATVAAGDGPSAITISSGSVWVANELGGTIARIDSSSNRVARTLTVGNRPSALAFGDGRVWALVRDSGAAHRGGVLHVAVAQPSLDSIDPAISYLLPPTQLLGVTNDGLVTLQHSDGTDGMQLVPDLAVSLPTPTVNGTTYRFPLRPGVHYSDGALVRPADFRRAIERDFVLHSPGISFYEGIVGAHRCISHPQQCDLSAGIVVNDRAQTVTFRLAAPDPDFLFKLALPFAAAIPASVPQRDVGRRPVPATGPYMIESYAPGRWLRLVRNPHFREWSRAAQPDGYPDQIVYRLGVSPEAAVTAIEHGKADWGIYDVPFSPPPDRIQELLTRHAAQVHANPAHEVQYFIMNTRTPPFDDVRVRRALNYAIDRNVLVRLNGGPTLAQPACQTLPPGLPGYRRYCPYTVNPSPGGAYSGPDLAKARRLVAASGTAGMRIRVLTDPHLPDTDYVVTVLRKLGYRASAWPVGGKRYNPLASNSQNKIQISVGGTPADYPAAGDIIKTWLSCGSYRPDSDANNNRAAFCDPKTEAAIGRALSLEASDPPAANRAWALVDQKITDQAPWLPTVNLQEMDYVSQRVGNYEFHPQWGLLLDQLWVK